VKPETQRGGDGDYDCGSCGDARPGVAEAGARRDGAANVALAADATQSATCAYLGAGHTGGAGVNAVFHIAWMDSLAALVAVPILSRRALGMAGQNCGC